MNDAHMALLARLSEHEGASLTSAASALGLALVDVERIAAELVADELLERMPAQ